MVLVTTALKETFPKNTDEKVLFLGEWCKVYNQKDFWQDYNFETLDYHWDDREKLLQDANYINDIYEKYLRILSKQLNKIHNEQHTTRYWRIVIGRWLGRFIEIVYDKHISIENAFIDNKIDKTHILDIKESDAVPFDMHDFNKIYINDDWNHFIYSLLIKHKQCNVIKVDYKQGITHIKTSGNKIKRMSMKLNHFNKIVFYASYIERKICVSLQLLLGQIPALDYLDELSLPASYDKNLRKGMDLSTANANSFETILQSLIKIQMPCSYLESYQELKRIASSRYAPKAKLIIASTSLAAYDDFKIWVANKVEDGTKLVVLQHGGYYATGLSCLTERHEIVIADKFFSWGWNRRGYDNIQPMPAIKLLDKISYNPNGDILMPLLSVQRYSSSLVSFPMSTQMLSYIKDQVDFLSLLSKEISKNVKLRVFPNDYGWNVKDRLVDYGFEGQIDSPENLNKKFIKRLSECCLCIATYNATIYLETFSSNFPTLLFWDKKYFEINQDAKPYFDKLFHAGILHYNARSLAKKVEEIYQNPMHWWMKDDIQQAKDEFCTQFANIGKSPISKWRGELKKIVNGKLD